MIMEAVSLDSGIFSSTLTMNGVINVALCVMKYSFDLLPNSPGRWSGGRGARSERV